MIDISGEERLTIADLVRRIDSRWGMDRPAVQRFDTEEVRRILGAVESDRGRTYPVSALPWWNRLAEARREKIPPLTPKEAGAWLVREMASSGEELRIAVPEPETALVPASPESLSAAAEVIARVVGQAILPPIEDRLIDAEEAGQMLHCSKQSAARLLRGSGYGPVRRGIWRRSDVLRYIAGLGQR